jgi:methylase of polypeptide subunit release factors
MSNQQEILSLFKRYSYELIFTIPWKKLDITRVSLFSENQSGADSRSVRSLVVNVLYSPIELLNIARFYSGRRPFLNFSACPEFYLRRLAKRRPESHMLITLFSQCKPVPEEEFRVLFGDSAIALLVQSRFLNVDNGMLAPQVRVHLFRNQLFVEPTANRSILDASYKLADVTQRCLPDLKHKRRLLDVGTGTGFHAILFAGAFEQAVALDIDTDALENTAQNCEINGTENVVGLQSDMYANVDGQFDLIMANPPPLFVPEGYRDNSDYGQFYDGGDFGIELARRIMNGFDEHLSDDGIAVIGLISSVVNGKDLVLDYIASTFDRRKYRVEVQVISDVIETEFVNFYRSHGISNRPRMIITFRKGRSGGVQVRKLNPVRSLLFLCQRTLAKFFVRDQ